MLINIDIETGPLPDKAIELFCEDDVKLGNLKDPKKVAEKIAQARDGAIEKAALSPYTGEVLIIGLLERESWDKPAHLTFLEGTEKEMIRALYMKLSDYTMKGKPDFTITEWSGHGHYKTRFDMDFLTVRTWINGLANFSPRFFAHRWKDLASYFLIEDATAYMKLDKACRILGIQDDPKYKEAWTRKDTLEVTGATFHDFYKSENEQEKAKAYAYLENDLIMNDFIASRLMPII
jgi:hypothetical protein